jgi:hypothetical protein
MTMSDAMERLRNGESALDAERRLMNEALGRLGKGESRRLGKRAAGRLIFGLDLTGSREPALKQARIATAAMFDAIKAIGTIELKLAYYRGTGECRESQWYADADILRRSMLQLSCETGNTQIAKLLRLALAQTETIPAFVFVGDHCEENPEVLMGLAQMLRAHAVPLFMFHECDDHDQRSLRAKPLFRRMAELSGGMYVEFKPDSSETLRELLSNVAAFSAAGVEGVKRMALPRTSEARQLQGSLRLRLGDGNTK